MTARAPRGRLMASGLSIPLLLCLCACDGREREATASASIRITTEDEIPSVGPEAGPDLSAELPAFAPPYPGAEVKTRIAKASKAGTTTGRVVVLLTPDSVGKVADFYDQKASAAGIRPAMIVTETDSAIRIFGNGDEAGSKAEGALIAITRSNDGTGTGTEIVITAGAALAEVKKWETRDWKAAPRPFPRLQ